MMTVQEFCAELDKLPKGAMIELDDLKGSTEEMSAEEFVTRLKKKYGGQVK